MCVTASGNPWCSRPGRGRRQGERLIHSYLDRWACEEGYRFSKQGFALEGVQARRFTTLQNLVALASLAWALLAAYQEDSGPLMEKAQHQKSKRPRTSSPFYSLLAGWGNEVKNGGRPAILDIGNHAYTPI